jgi:ketosteroid isomerase-like protein
MKLIIPILILTFIAFTASPSRAQESPAATAAVAEPAPAVSKDKSAIEAALKDNENKWEAAVAKHDASIVEALVAADYVGFSSKGKPQTRATIMEEMKKDTDTYTSTANESLDVHVLGPDVAVVAGTSREKGKAKDGKAFNRSFRWVDTWMQRDGKWQCVASGNMLMPAK